MIKTLKYIIEQFGEDTLRDGNKLIAMYLDLEPRQKIERQMLEHLVKCDGNNRLLDAKEYTPKEKKKAYLAVVSLLMTQENLAEENAHKLCGIFWTAIGEDPIDFTTRDKSHIPGIVGTSVAGTPKKTNGKMIAAVAAAAVLLIALVAGQGGRGGQDVSEPVLNNPTVSDSTSSNPTVPDSTEKVTEAERIEQNLETASGKKLSQIKYIDDEYPWTTTYSYNSIGKLDKIDFDNEYTPDMVFEYSDDGHFLKMESESSGDAYDYDYSYLELVYDDNRVASLLWGNYEEGSVQWDYDYDDDGRISLISTGYLEIKCEYDNSGRLTTATRTSEEGYSALIHEYTYDAENRLASIIETTRYEDGDERIMETYYSYNHAPIVLSTSTGEFGYYTVAYLDYAIFEDIAVTVPLLMTNHFADSYWAWDFYLVYEDLNWDKMDEDGNLISLNADSYSSEVQFEFVYSE